MFKPSVLWIQMFAFLGGMVFYAGVRDCIRQPANLNWIGDFLMTFIALRFSRTIANKLKYS